MYKVCVKNTSIVTRVIETCAVLWFVHSKNGTILRQYQITILVRNIYLCLGKIREIIKKMIINTYTP